MRILITGSSGFLGKHVVKELDNKHELLTPSRQELDWLEYRATYWDCEFGDLENYASYLRGNKIDAVVHLAGNVGGIGYNQHNQAILGFENLQMGLNVLEASRLAGVRKLVILGTTCSYPCTPKTIPFIEEELFDGMPELTNSGYGISKRTLIKLGIEYYNQYGMNITNLVPANMYGPRDHFNEKKSHVIPAIIKKFESRDEYLLLPGVPKPCISLWGSGEASREFLYVTDCARAIALSLEQDTGPDPINLGTGSEITIAVLADTIKRIGSYDAVVAFDNRNPDGQPRRCLNVSRAKDILGWKATTSLEIGLKQTIEWYRANG